MPYCNNVRVRADVFPWPASVEFSLPRCAAVTSYYTVRRDLYVHGPMGLSSRINTRSPPLGLIPLSLLTYLACIRLPLPCIAPASPSCRFPYVPPSGACHESSFFLRPSLLRIRPLLALPHLPVISHRSFILFHASGTSGSNGIYLLLAKHAAPPPYHFSSIFILHPFSPTRSLARSLLVLPARAISLETLALAANFPICIFHFLSFPVASSHCDRIFLCVPRSPRPKSLVQSGFSVVLTVRRSVPYSPCRAYQRYRSLTPYSSASLDLAVSWCCCLLFSSPESRPSSLFSYFSIRLVSQSESLYTGAFPVSRSRRFFPRILSNLPEIVLFLSRDRLCHRSSISPPVAHGLLVASLRSEYSFVLIFSGLFCFPYLPALLEPRLIRKHTPSLLPRFSRFLFFDLRCR